MTKVRCAIYTRKSSEEGLQQDFNSLDAQREACAAYILSQASEGWSLLPQQYNDGGLSGGSLERPALQRLLSDVAAGRIDIIVVYKVDRLTRLLLDFAKLVEAFEKAGTSFVSVTQSFNTTTSMGRLTLNMLLSFAQFEREVTAERIRDKIAASKAKGMWMGGTPPLGYRPNGRSLAIVEEHAAIVRDIYGRYLEIGNVRLVAEQLGREGIKSPERVSGKGRKFGGCQFSRGQLYAILKNPVYVGDVLHRGQSYSGQQPAIIDRATWSQVQQRLAQNVRGERRARAASPSPLAGLIVDEAGESLVAVHACKGRIRYRYYISRSLQHGGEITTRRLRLPAREIELLVIEHVAALFEDPLRLAARACITVAPGRALDMSHRCRAIAAELRKGSRAHLTELVSRVRVLGDQIEISLSTLKVTEALGVASGAPVEPAFAVTAAGRVTRTGRAMRLVQPSGSPPVSSPPDPTLIKLLLKASRWWSRLSGALVTVTTLAREEGVTPAYVTRVVRLAFLAPVVVESILAGRQPSTANAASLTATEAISGSWQVQMSRFLPSTD